MPHVERPYEDDEDTSTQVGYKDHQTRFNITYGRAGWLDEIGMNSDWRVYSQNATGHERVFLQVVEMLQQPQFHRRRTSPDTYLYDEDCIAVVNVIRNLPWLVYQSPTALVYGYVLAKRDGSLDAVRALVDNDMDVLFHAVKYMHWWRARKVSQ